MNVNIINSFITIIKEICNCFGIEIIEIKKPMLVKNRLLTQGVIVIIEIIKQLEGKCCLTMTEKTMLALAGILNNTKYEKVDAMVLSTICEIGNMISGRVVGSLSRLKYNCEITPPMLFFGTMKLTFITPLLNYICVPIETNCGTLYLNISISTNS